MADRITLRELMRMVEDEATHLEEIRAYFVASPNRDAPFSPGFEINPELVELPTLSEGNEGLEGIVADGLRGWINSWAVPGFNRRYMRRRQKIYHERVLSGWGGLKFVAEGDSWFQYPWDYDDDLIDYLMEPYAIYCLSAAGDLLSNMLDGKSVLIDAIKSTDADGLLLSGGGNDIAGKQLFGYLEHFDPAYPNRAAEEYVGAEFQAFLNHTEGRLRAFFSKLAQGCPHLKIFLHGYDHPIPRERGPWLGPTLKDKEIPPSLWRPILGLMIDRYNALLRKLEKEFQGRVFVTDLRGTAGERGWRDELHLEPAYCEKAALALQKTIDGALPPPVLEAAGGPGSEVERLEAVDARSEVQLSDLDNVRPEVEAEIDLIPDEPIGLEAARAPLTLGVDELHLESLGRRLPRVYWPRDDRKAPDYAHLESSSPREPSFTLVPEDLDLLIAANRFSPVPHQGKIAFALRGAQLEARSHQVEDASELALVDVRPNHTSFRCVVGFYDRDARRLWAYTGSTVPNARNMAAYYRRENQLPGEKRLCNLLPTGCYIYRRNPHGWSKKRGRFKVPVALRLSSEDPSVFAGAATVLRTSNDLVFGTADTWDLGIPTDNIHPAFSMTSFASAGCITVRGHNKRFTTEASGQWKSFLRQLAEIPEGDRIDLLLLTGAEASIASSLRVSSGSIAVGDVEKQLVRLRTGSKGAEVRGLQEKLGLPADGYFGPITKKALAAKQSTVPELDGADGIYGPRLDSELGWDIFGRAT